MSWMLKNSSGERDGMMTFAVLSFFITAFCIIAPMFNGFLIPWADYVISIETPDTTLIMALLAAGFTSYVVRRNAKLKADTEEVKSQLENGIIK